VSDAGAFERSLANRRSYAVLGCVVGRVITVRKRSGSGATEFVIVAASACMWRFNDRWCRAIVGSHSVAQHFEKWRARAIFVAYEQGLAGRSGKRYVPIKMVAQLPDPHERELGPRRSSPAEHLPQIHFHSGVVLTCADDSAANFSAPSG